MIWKQPAPWGRVPPGMGDWFVYLIRTSDDALYAGVSTDVDRRLAEHSAGKGAKALRGRGPLRVAFRRRLGDRGLAQRVEALLKRLTKAQKEALVLAAPSRARLLRLLERDAT